MLILRFLTQLCVMVFLTTGCDRYSNVGDVAAGIATGGLLPLPKDYDSFCEWGLEKCDTSSTNEKTTTTKTPNRPPRIEFYVSKLDMNVGDRRNLLLNIVDPDDDNISQVNYFIEDPAMALLKLTKDPHILEVYAKKEGNTNIRIIAKDKYLNQGKSDLLPLAILDPNATNNRQVKLTKTLVQLDANTSTTLKYVYTGFKPSYSVTPTTNNKLVSVSITKPSETIIIQAGGTAGTDEIQLTFADGTGVPIVKRVQVLIKAEEIEQGGGDKVDPNPNPNPDPKPDTTKPTETDLVVYNDPNACLTAAPWSKISHRFSETKDKFVSPKNQLSIQSLANYTDEKGNIYDKTSVYYKAKSDILETPFGISIASPGEGLPINAQQRSPKIKFILQANPTFINNGYFYLEIGPFCYRGKWPNSDSSTQSLLAQLSIKLVLNNGTSPSSETTKTDNSSSGNSGSGSTGESDGATDSSSGTISPLPMVQP